VLAISVDALNPQAIQALGRERAPNFHRLMDEGVFTLNARTERELTETLPNHTSMVTGRRITASEFGHGVDFNRNVPGSTVQAAAGHPVSSMFTVVHAAGRGTAFFATEAKMGIFERSWDAGIDRSTIRQDRDGAVARAARRDLIAANRALTFVHLGKADTVGHAAGGMSPAYLDAVAGIDAQLGKFLDLIERRDELGRSMVVIVLADHGTNSLKHDDATKPANYRVPFFAWGPGITPGDLYARNDAYQNPGKARTAYAGTQPIRNGDLANLVTSLLGLRAVPGSQFGDAQQLDVRAP